MAVVSAVSAGIAESDAAKPTAKTTNLNIELVATACRNYSLTPLVEAQGFETANATAYGYDESHSVGPRGETRRRARERPCRALVRGQITTSGRQPATTYAHACLRSNRCGAVKANRPWPPYEDAAYGDAGGHDQVLCVRERSDDANVRTFSLEKNIFSKMC